MLTIHLDKNSSPTLWLCRTLCDVCLRQPKITCATPKLIRPHPHSCVMVVLFQPCSARDLNMLTIHHEKNSSPTLLLCQTLCKVCLRQAYWTHAYLIVLYDHTEGLSRIVLFPIGTSIFQCTRLQSAKNFRCLGLNPGLLRDSQLS